MIGIWCAGVLCVVSPAAADTLHLANGRAMEGFVLSEDNGRVEFDVGSGTVTFARDAIQSIDRSTPAESDVIRKKWVHANTLSRTRQLEKVPEPEQVPLNSVGQGITVDAVLNHKTRVSLLLDTGASTVLISRRVAEELGFDIAKMRPNMKVQVADGRTIKAVMVVLENVRVKDAEASSVAAAVLLDAVPLAGTQDGLLGMSFLNRFNFKVDYRYSKLVLEKL